MFAPCFDEFNKAAGHVVNLFRNTRNNIASLTVSAWRGFDVKDVFVFGGLPMLGYGLFLHWGLWLALVVCGSILIILGFVMTAMAKT